MGKGKKTLWVLVVILVIFLSAYLASNIILDRQIMRLERKLAEEEATLSDLVPPPIPDEENAAPIFLKADEAIKSIRKKYSEEEREKIAETTSGVWKEENRDLIEGYLKDNEEALSLVDNALAKKKCNWNVKYEEGFGALLPHLSALRQCAHLLKAKGLLEEHKDEPGKALDSYLKILSLGQCAGKDCLISQLVMFVIKDYSLRAVVDLLEKEKFSDVQYRRIITELETNDIQERDMWKCLKMERVLGMIEMNRMIADPKHRILTFKLLLPDSSPGFSPAEKRLVLTLKAFPQICKLDKLYFLKAYKKLFDLSGQPYYKISDEIEGLIMGFRQEAKLITSSRPLLLRHYFYATLFPSINIAFHNQAISITKSETLKIAAGLKLYKSKYGTYPDNLAALTPGIFTVLPVDPFDGEGFIYRKAGNGFVIYGVGENGKDDKGFLEGDARENRKQWREQGDIGWRFKN